MGFSFGGASVRWNYGFHCRRHEEVNEEMVDLLDSNHSETLTPHAAHSAPAPVIPRMDRRRPARPVSMLQHDSTVAVDPFSTCSATSTAENPLCRVSP